MLFASKSKVSGWASRTVSQKPSRFAKTYKQYVMSVMSTQSTHHLYWCALTMCMVSYAFHKMSRVAQSLSKRRSSAISATRSMRSWWFVAVNLSSLEIFVRATPCRHCYEMLRILHPIQFKCVLRQFPWNNGKILQNATVHLYPP